MLVTKTAGRDKGSVTAAAVTAADIAAEVAAFLDPASI